MLWPCCYFPLTMNPKSPKGLRSPKSGSPHTDSLAANAVPRPVSAFARTNKAGLNIKQHAHERDQLIYAIHGVMTIRTHDSIWTIPPSYSLWIPARVVHAVKMDTEVEMRTLYFQQGVIAAQSTACQVRAVSPLLRELIIRAMSIPPLYDEEGPDGCLMRVIVDEVCRQESVPLLLKLPKDRRLEQLCRHLLSSLDQSESIGLLGAKFGLSERSIIRLFPLETGLTLHRWRQQARLMRAFALAEQGKSLGAIAGELGYCSQSAFAKMFRKIFGQSPREILSQK